MNNNLAVVDWEKVAKIFAPDKENWEKKLKKGIDKYPTTKELLKILAVGGFISLAIIALPVAGMLAKEMRWQEKSRFNQRLGRLRKRKLVNITYQNGETMVEITQDGRKKALEYKFEEIQIKKPPKWDGKWRLVIFDVSNHKRKQRDRLREKLKEIGFRTLNESVLIFPHSCPDEIEFIRQVFDLGQEVIYLTVDRFEGDSYYEDWFFPKD